MIGPSSWEDFYLLIGASSMFFSWVFACWYMVKLFTPIRPFTKQHFNYWISLSPDLVALPYYKIVQERKLYLETESFEHVFFNGSQFVGFQP